MSATLQIRHHSYQFTDKTTKPAFYLEKIDKYGNECGCTLGAIFTAVAIVGFGAYIFFNGWSDVNLIKTGLSGLIFVLLSAALGKFIGIAIARIRLKLLYKSLIKMRYLKLIEPQ